MDPQRLEEVKTHLSRFLDKDGLFTEESIRKLQQTVESPGWEIYAAAMRGIAESHSQELKTYMTIPMLTAIGPNIVVADAQVKGVLKGIEDCISMPHYFIDQYRVDEARAKESAQ